MAVSKSKSSRSSSVNDSYSSTAETIPSTLSAHWYEDALTKALDVLNLKHGNLRLLNTTTGNLDLMAARGFPTGYIKKFRTLKIGQRSAGKIIRSRGPILWDNIQTDPSCAYLYLRKQGINSMVGVPLMGREGLVGTLIVASRKKGAFGEEELKLLTSMGRVVGTAVESNNLMIALRRSVDELTKLNRQLEEANETKHRLLSVISHELRTPMSVILGNVDLLIDQTFGGVSEKQRKSLETVRRNGVSLLFQIENALEVAELEVGGLAVHPENFKIDRVRDALTSLFQDEVARKHLKIHWEIDPRLPELFSDQEKITRVFRNLIDNAIKFTEKGGVTVNVSFSSRRKRVECTVEDTGIGISPAQFKVIFDPFHQVDSSHTRLYGGMGLGLRNVQRTIELLGGEIKVESTLSRGSIFQFWFPAEYRQPE
jgi:signal transduction histidine kinase